VSEEKQALALVTVAAKRPERKKFIVTVVFQIKNLGKAGRIGSIVFSEPIGLLVCEQVIHSALDFMAACLACRK